MRPEGNLRALSFWEIRMSGHEWEAIERAWGAGTPSIRALALRHGVAESTIRHRARIYAWPERGSAPAAEEDVGAKHRRDIARLSRLREGLAAKAARLVEAAESVRELADAAAAVERLGRITERLIALERQAHGLEAEGANGADFAETLRKARERAEMV